MPPKKFEKPPGLSDIRGKYTKKNSSDSYSYIFPRVSREMVPSVTACGSLAFGSQYVNNHPPSSTSNPSRLHMAISSPQLASTSDLDLHNRISQPGDRSNGILHRLVNQEGVTTIALAPDGRLILPEMDSSIKVKIEPDDHGFMSSGNVEFSLPDRNQWDANNLPGANNNMSKFKEAPRNTQNRVRFGAMSEFHSGSVPNNEISEAELEFLMNEISSSMALPSNPARSSAPVNPEDPFGMHQRLPAQFRSFERYLEDKFGLDGATAENDLPSTTLALMGEVAAEMLQRRDYPLPQPPSGSPFKGISREANQESNTHFPSPSSSDSFRMAPPASVSSATYSYLNDSVANPNFVTSSLPFVDLPLDTRSFFLPISNPTQLRDSTQPNKVQVESRTALFSMTGEDVSSSNSGLEDGDETGLSKLEPAYQNLPIGVQDRSWHFSFPNVAFTEVEQLVPSDRESFLSSISWYLEADYQIEPTLPPGWSQGRSPLERRYYAHEDSQSTTWHHPLLESEIPFGWERVDSLREGVYYHNVFMKHSQRYHPNLWFTLKLKPKGIEDQPCFSKLRRLQNIPDQGRECHTNVKAYYSTKPGLEEQRYLLFFMKLSLEDLQKANQEIDELCWQELQSIVIAYEGYRAALARTLFAQCPPNSLFETNDC